MIIVALRRLVHDESDLKQLREKYQNLPVYESTEIIELINDALVCDRLQIVLWEAEHWLGSGAFEKKVAEFVVLSM